MKSTIIRLAIRNNSLRSAPEMEDASEKHPVTPGPVRPAREMLGDLLLELNEAAERWRLSSARDSALRTASTGCTVAAAAAQAAGQRDKATQYFSALIHVSDPTSSRPELGTARSYLQEGAQK
jgi:hypothetical protein